MQTYEYIVVTDDNKIHRIIADSIKGVLEAFDEDETPIINIFRNNAVTKGAVYEQAVIHAEVTPPVAFTTGCRAYPAMPVTTKQGEAVVLTAVCPAGWKLDGWYCNGKNIGSELQMTVIVEDAGEVTYTASFIPAI